MSKIVSMFEKTCTDNAGKPAVVYSNAGTLVSKSFDDLLHDVYKSACYLKDKGVRKGDRILAFAPSSYELCAFMLASLKVGASVMYVDIWAKQESLRNIFNDYRPNHIIVSHKTKWVRFLFGEIGKIKNVISIENVGESKFTSSDFSEIEENSIALLTMTTGSTGKPKVAIRTHENLYKQLDLINQNIDPSNKNITVLTTSYIYVFANILNGFTTVLPQINIGKCGPKKIDKKLKVFSGVPIDMIITSPDFCLKAKNTFPKLKTLYFGGAILNLNEAKRIKEKYATSNNYVVYGSTECNIISMIDLDGYIDNLKNKKSAILGCPVNGVNIKINENEEILVSSDALLENYLVKDFSNKYVDEGGQVWHNTGDTGKFENEVIEYYGRSKFFVNIGGKKVYCNQIEQNIVTTFSDIKKCAILERNGNIFLFIEKGKNINLENVAKLLKNDYKIESASIRLIKEIPCDVKHHTKINYAKLNKMIRGV